MVWSMTRTSRNLLHNYVNSGAIRQLIIVLDKVRKFKAALFNLQVESIDCNFYNSQKLNILQGGFSALFYGEIRSEEHTSELQSRENLVCRLLLEKKKHKKK